MTDLALVCPTRGRAEICAHMIESAHAKSSADVLLYVDSDDPDAGDVLLLSDPRTKVTIGHRIGRGIAVNELCRLYPDYRMYLLVSDDIVFTRDDWEPQVRRAMDDFGDDLGVVHLASENGMPHVNWACVSRRWIDTLGWFNPPKLATHCQDTVIGCLGEGLGRVTYVTPQAIQHAVVRRPDFEAHAALDMVEFLRYMACDFGGDLRKLRAAQR